MFSVTLLQISLLLLSAYWQIYALMYYDINGSPLARSQDASVKCESNVEVVKWLNDQTERNTKLAGVSSKLSKILDTLNSSIYGKIPEENCCFLEPGDMEKMMHDLTNISTTKNIMIDRPLVPTGNLGDDLDLLLSTMKFVAGKGTLSCCDRLYGNLTTMESRLQFKLEILRNKLGDDTSSYKAREECIKQHNSLEIELRNIKIRLNELNEKNTDHEAELNKCCNELNGRVDAFEKEFDMVKGQAVTKAQSLDKQMKNMSKTQDEQERLINDISSISKHNTEIAMKVAGDCKKIVSEMGKGIQGFGNANSADSPMNRLHELENKVANLATQAAKLQNISKSLEDCERLNKDIAKLQDTIQKVQANFPALDTCDIAGLQQEIGKAKECCKNFEKLAEDTMDLKNQIQKINANYNNQFSTMESAIKDIQDQMNETRQTLNELVNTRNNVTDTINKRIQGLTGQVDDLSNKMNVTRNKVDDNTVRTNELKDEVKAMSVELIKIHEDRIQSANALKKELEEKFKKLYMEINNCSTKTYQDLDFCTEEYRFKHNELRKMITRLFMLENKLKDLDQQVKEMAEKIRSNDKKMTQCAKNCKNMDKLDDLINRIKALEKLKDHNILPQRSSPRKVTTKKKIGGLFGSVDEPYGIST